MNNCYIKKYFIFNKLNKMQKGNVNLIFGVNNRMGRFVD